MKKLLVWLTITILLCLVLPTQTFAQGNQPPIPTAPRSGFVLDTLDWLTPEQEAEINSINKNLDHDGIAQIAVVTLDDCGTDKKTFRHDLFNAWGIGHADTNDGVLILVCWYDGDKSRRSVEQEVGYGLEDILPPTLTDETVQKYFAPAFQQDQPGNGLMKMVSQYDKLVKTNPLRKKSPAATIAQPQSNPAQNTQSQSSYDWMGNLSSIACCPIGVIVLALFALLLRQIRSDRSGGGKNKSKDANTSTTTDTATDNSSFFFSSFGDTSSSGSFDSSSSSSDFGGGSSGDSGSSTGF